MGKMADLAQESIWFNKAQCDDAERMYFEKLSGAKVGGAEGLTAQIQRARQHIKNSLECVDGLVAQSGDIDMALASKLNDLVLENEQLKKVTSDLKGLILKLESRVAVLEGGAAPKSSAPAAPAAAEEDDDDVDLFGSDD